MELVGYIFDLPRPLVPFLKKNILLLFRDRGHAHEGVAVAAGRGILVRPAEQRRALAPPGEVHPPVPWPSPRVGARHSPARQARTAPATRRAGALHVTRGPSLTLTHAPH